MTIDLVALAKEAERKFQALSPSEKLRHLYMQRRSFAIGQCPSKRNFEEYKAEVIRRMPDPEGLSDAEIGLVLMGRYEK